MSHYDDRARRFGEQRGSDPTVVAKVGMLFTSHGVLHDGSHGIYRVTAIRRGVVYYKPTWDTPGRPRSARIDEHLFWTEVRQVVS